MDSPPRHLLTHRLDLRPADPTDTAALFPIFSDPDGWWYEPHSRHRDVDRTRAFLRRAAERWAEGLSYWTVRERAGGAVIGLGGAQRHASGAWNVSYRLASAVQGRGYATELGRAALAAAHAADPDAAVIAWVLPENLPSRRVAERLGLRERGLRLDANDGVTRLAYSDRPLE